MMTELREAKPGREKVLEYDHLVRMGLRVHIRLQGNSPEAERNQPSLLHVLQHSRRHLGRTKESRRQSLSLFWGHGTFNRSHHCDRKGNRAGASLERVEESSRQKAQASSVQQAKKVDPTNLPRLRTLTFIGGCAKSFLPLMYYTG